MLFQLAKHMARWMRVAGILAAALLAAQDTSSTVRVYTSIYGPWVRVDGQQYNSQAIFRWPAGSRHEIGTEAVQPHPSRDGVRYLFRGWSIAGRWSSPDLVVPFIADPTIAWVRADFELEYQLRVRFAPCIAGSISPGTLLINGAPYTCDAELWAPAGTVFNIQAQPNPNFVFTGWQMIPGGTSSGFINSIVLNQPMTLVPKFATARQIRLDTVPAGFQLMADYTRLTAPVTMGWAYGSVHTLAPVSPQIDLRGKYWVFHSWSNNQPAVHAYTVESGSEPVTITATYVPGAHFTIHSSPPGLKLRVDDRDDWTTTNFVWGAGETHRIEAPPVLKDSLGRTCVFVGWSNGGDAVQDITVDDSHVAQGANLVAIYETLAHVTLRASEPGISFTVDGEECPGPCLIEPRPGTAVAIVAPEQVAAADGVRLEFAGWSDGVASSERSLSPASTDLETLTAIYRVMVRLAAVSDPPEAALFSFDPPSPDGYYEARSNVYVMVEPQSGYRFFKWEGALSGSRPYGVVRMVAPQTVRAIFHAVPHVAEAGIVNGAGETPVAGVAPGSVISIYGSGLSGETLAGPESPLAQTLGGVTVRVEDRLLPLFFVSPNQINAQLPSDLELGTRRLTIERAGEEPVEGTFEAVRHAPGLFQQIIEGRSYATVARADGSAVTPDSPGGRGETVILYGTGFGPYDQMPFAGFPVPADPPYRLIVEPVLVAGEAAWEVIDASAAPGRTGIDAVRFRIPDDAPPGIVELKVRVGDVESNTVLLPIE